jgi:hypothetical protein
MKKIFLILTIIITCVIKTIASECPDKDSIEKAVKNSDLVIKGFVISSQIVDSIDSLSVIIPENDSVYTFPLFSWNYIQYKILVLEVYKGKVKGDTIIIMTGTGDQDWGFLFEIGKNYIIYAISERNYRKKWEKEGPCIFVGDYYTDICSRTTLFNDKERSEILKKR